MCRGFRLHQALKPEPFHPEPERGPGADPGESVNAPTDEQVLVHCPDLVGPPADEIRISRNVMGDPNDVETFPERVPAGATSNLAAPKWPMKLVEPMHLAVRLLPENLLLGEDPDGRGWTRHQRNRPLADD